MNHDEHIASQLRWTAGTIQDSTSGGNFTLGDLRAAGETAEMCIRDSSYAAAAIAGSNPSSTGWAAFKMAIPAFLIPFAFWY